MGRLSVCDPVWYNFCSCCKVVREFRNAEAAFQALKFWRIKNARELENDTGARARERGEQLAGREDSTYTGFGTRWLAMQHVLRAKFTPGTELANALLKTESDFLLQYNEDASSMEMRPARRTQMSLASCSCCSERSSAHPHRVKMAILQRLIGQR